MPIDYFSRVDEGTIHAPDLATASPDQILAAYKKGEDAYVPRNFLIYVDLGYLPPGLPQPQPQRDLATSSRGSGRNDAVRVVVFNRSPKVLVDWTTSKETAMAALSAIETRGRRHVAPAEPDADDRHDRRASGRAAATRAPA